MDFKEIQELVKLVSKLGLGEVTVKEGDFKITVKGLSADHAQVAMPVAPQVVAVPAQQAPPQAAAPAAKPEIPAAAPAASAEESTAGLVAIKSPMVGTFYRSATPEKPPFIKVGDEVGVGTKVCIIEAMKLFNEIESEVKGKVVKVLVEDKSPVEYDQVLFLIDPK